MTEKSNFHTLKGYSLHDNQKMTASMEDYLEMICRLSANNEAVRINALAENLNVKPSSASKMANNLKTIDLICFEKYGTIKLTEEGILLGNYLLYRHEILHDLLCFINNTGDELEQVEKIEHFINEETIRNIDAFIQKYCDKRPGIFK